MDGVTRKLTFCSSHRQRERARVKAFGALVYVNRGRKDSLSRCREAARNNRQDVTLPYRHRVVSSCCLLSISSPLSLSLSLALQPRQQPAFQLVIYKGRFCCCADIPNISTLIVSHSLLFSPYPDRPKKKLLSSLQNRTKPKALEFRIPCLFRFVFSMKMDATKNRNQSSWCF